MGISGGKAENLEKQSQQVHDKTSKSFPSAGMEHAKPFRLFCACPADL
jgi:hypothetical protein